jgi:hypothetical protein
MIATLGWLAGCTLFVGIIVWGLCRAAAQGDRDLLAPHPDEQDQLADVAHLCEARHRRDVRNGLGRAS